MSKSIRIYREHGFYIACGHPEIGCHRYCNLESLVAELFYAGISPLDIDFSDIDKTFLNYERNED